MDADEPRPGIAPRPRPRGLLERLSRFQQRELAFLLAGAGVLILVPASEQFLPGPAAEGAASAPGLFAAAPARLSDLPARLGRRLSPAAAGAEDWRAELPEPGDAAAPDSSLDVRDPSALAMGPDASAQPPARSPLPALSGERLRSAGSMQSFSRAAAAGVSAASAWSGLPRPKDSWMKAGRRSFLVLSRDGLRAIVGGGRSAARLDSAAIHSAYTKLAPNQTATSAYDPKASPESYVVSGEFDRPSAGSAGNPIGAPSAGDKAPVGKKEESRTFPGEKPEPVKDKGEKDFNSGASSPQGAGAKPSLTGQSGADLRGLGHKTLAQICADLRGVPFNPMAQKLMRAIGLVTVAEVNLHEGGQLICAEGVVPQRFAKDPLDGKASDVNAILQRVLGVLQGQEVLPPLKEAVQLCKQADGKAAASAGAVSRDASRELARANIPCTVNRFCCDSYVRVQGICQPTAQSPCKDAMCAECETANKTARQTAVREVNSKVKDTGCSGFKGSYDDIENGFQHGQTPLRKAEKSVAALNREKVGPALEAMCRGAAQAKECRFESAAGGGASEEPDHLHRISGLLAQARQSLDELSLTSADTAETLKVTQDWKDWVRDVQGQAARVNGVFQEQVKLVNRISPVLPKLEKAAPRWEQDEFAVDQKAVIPKLEIDELTEQSVLKQDSGTALKPVLVERWCQSPPKVNVDCDNAQEVTAAIQDNEGKVRPVVANAQKKQKDETSKRVLDAVQKALDAAKP